MKNGFLEALSKQIRESDIPIGNQNIILPTQRAIYHLKLLLSDGISSGELLPRFLTLNEWLSEIAELTPASQFEQQVQAYRAYKKHLGSDSRSFGDFTSWSAGLLSDFNDIDNYLIDSQSLFRNLNEYTEIENFSFLSDPLSEKQLRVKAFWAALPKIYEDYKSGLLAQGLAYPGLIARMTSAKIASLEIKGDFSFVIGGFNAMSASEEACIRQLEKKIRCEVFFDADSYYLNSKNNHAGYFIRKFVSNDFGKVLNPSLSLGTKPQQIGFHSAKHDIDQAEIVGHILSKLSVEEQDETAVVLAEESLLIPILRRIPENILKPNITMGLKASEGTFATWLDEVFAISRATKGEVGSKKIKNSDWQSFYQHPFTKAIQIKASNLKGEIPIEKIAREVKAPEGIVELLSIIWQSSSINPENLLRLFEALGESKSLKAASSFDMRLNLKGILALSKALRELLHYEEGKSLDTASLQKLCNSHLSRATLALKGDANSGVQIMGLLETRALNYKNIILCSVNEGSLPRAGQSDSFIPFEIRKFHKLPGIKERESVYAYYFYRLIQHSENISLIYNLSQEGFNAKEPSRYLSQLKYELKEVNPEVQITEFTSRAKPKVDLPDQDPVFKTPEIIALIKDQLVIRLSASSINLFLSDSLEWYYNYILKIREPKSTEITPATFGDVVHEVLEKAYEPFEGQILSEDSFKVILKNAERLLPEILTALLGANAFETGANRMQFEIAKRTISSFINSDKASIQKDGEVHYIKGELELERYLEVTTEEGPVKVKFFGLADRVERRNGVLSILDYKTGSVKKEDLKFEDFTPESFASKGKAFQLMLYKWLALGNFSDKEIKTRIISLPKPNIDDFIPECAEEDIENMDRFEDVLRGIVQSMLDPKVPFSHSEEYAYGIFE